MRANGAVRELDFVERCTTPLYQWQEASRAASAREDTFILHDGPPFANGSLHMGHFLNKVVKDALNRHHLLLHKRIHYIPGWDCHGLPIELKALEAARKSRDTLTAVETRRIARGLAEATIAQHKRDFQRWGILADWAGEAGTYNTMAPRYEAQQLRVFARMARHGLVARSLRPVHWSPSSCTALAEAELEFREDHCSRAAYVGFPLGDGVRAVVWTTTPWTLVSNCAIAVHPETRYAVAREVGGAQRAVLVAEELVPAVAEALNLRLQVVETMPGRALEGRAYRHPLLGDQTAQQASERPAIFHTILCGNHVTTDAGTGLVHTAPAHGADDYDVWRAYGGSIEACPSPVDAQGRFSLRSETGCGPAASERLWRELEGVTVEEGGQRILEALEAEGELLLGYDHTHRYPYDWRTKQPVIMRATRQWFIQLHGLKEKAAKALSDVELVPEGSRGRMEGMVQGRQEWCISRQRQWGVPLPALVQEETGEVALSEELIEKVAEKVEMYGSDWWWTAEEEEVEALAGPGWKRGSDTLDVWFDSGCSWKAVLDGTKADVYMEGSDQHRGWFQSSLLTKLGSEGGKAPYAKIITHGFVLDDRSRKMSKSLGNSFEPSDYIPELGVDVLRTWVATVDYTSDVAFSRSAVDQAAQALRKVRNSARFLLGNLHNFDPETDAPDPASLSLLDRFMLHKAVGLVENVRGCYDKGDLRNGFAQVLHFASNDISAIYAESAKDILYSEAPASPRRKSCQFVLWQLLQSLTVAAAPITVFLAEDIYSHAVSEFAGNGAAQSVFQSSWNAPSLKWRDDSLNKEVECLLSARTQINKLLDQLRGEGKLDSRSQAELVFAGTNFTEEELVTMKQLVQVAQCFALEKHAQDEVPSKNGAGASLGKAQLGMGDTTQAVVFVRQSSMEKCERCWQYHAEDEGSLCARCEEVVGEAEQQVQ